MTFVQAAAMALLKLFFYNTVDVYNPGWQFVYFAATAILAALFIRTVGIMNYLEAIFIAAVWLVFDFLVDSLVVYPLTGNRIFYLASFWLGYLFFLLFVFTLHKKRHIAIRRGELHEHHH
jgi:hypothetical protein